MSAALILGLYGAAFLPYAWLIFRVRDGRLDWRVVLGLAITLRVVLLAFEPVLSDDLYRYVWEGRVTMAGFNPFAMAPGHEGLAHLRDAAIWPKVNHPEVSTIYPPVAQGLFALNAWLGGGTVLMRVIFLVVEAIGVWSVWRLLGDRATLFALAAYALNPLVIIETAWSGHLDVIAWTPLVVGLLAWRRWPGVRGAAGAGAILGLGIAAKFLGLIALPLLVLGRRPEGEPWRIAIPRRLAVAAVALLVAAASYAPFLDAGPDLFRGFGTYSAHWRSNDGIYRLWTWAGEAAMEAWASPEDRMTPGDETSQALFRMTQWDAFFLERGWTKTWEGQVLPATSFTADQIARTAAKAAAAFAVALALLWCLICERDPLRGALVVLLTLFVVAPTVHPWYVAWLVPLAALRPRAAAAPAALVFSGVVLVAYWAWASSLDGGPWAIPWWAVALEYGAVAAALFWDRCGCRSDPTSGNGRAGARDSGS